MLFTLALDDSATLLEEFFWTLDEELISELHEDDEILELLDFTLLEEDSVTLLLEEDKTLELLDFTLLEEDSITLLLEEDKTLELLDFTLLEEDSTTLQEDTLWRPDDKSSSSPPTRSPVAVQATKKAAMKPPRKIFKGTFFIPEIYIKKANTGQTARQSPPKELYYAKNRRFPLRLVSKPNPRGNDKF